MRVELDGAPVRLTVEARYEAGSRREPSYLEIDVAAVQYPAAYRLDTGEYEGELYADALEIPDEVYLELIELAYNTYIR
jgi:hypothetical protein